MPVSPALVTESTQIAARAAIGAALLAVAALVVLHAVRRDLDPGWHVISEYAVGAQGWIMGLCFAAFAAASLALGAALIGQLPTLTGRIGLACLIAAGVGLALAALFPMDPITTAPADASLSGRMHGVSFMIGVPGEILAVLLLSLALRARTDWAGAPLLPLTAVIWISLVVMAAGIMLASKGGMNGPGLLGWANRLLMIGYAAWIAVVAWPLARWG